MLRNLLSFGFGRIVLFVCSGLIGCSILSLGCGTVEKSGSDQPGLVEAAATAEGDQARLEPDQGGEGEVSQTVRVRIIKNSGESSIDGEVAWVAEMTVFDVISQFSPNLNVVSTGQGESLFVKSIAGQDNLGSSGDNWIYRVNGKLGDRSCGVFVVAPGDEVIWSFGKYQLEQ